VELDSRRIAFRDCEVEGRHRAIGLAFGDTLRSLKSTYRSHDLHVFSLVGRPSLLPVLQRCAPDLKFQGTRRYTKYPCCAVPQWPSAPLAIAPEAIYVGLIRFVERLSLASDSSRCHPRHRPNRIKSYLSELTQLGQLSLSLCKASDEEIRSQMTPVYLRTKTSFFFSS
jgi:hypothetical protein